MKKEIIFLIMLIILFQNAYAFTSNSSNYKLILTTVSDGGENISSSSYKNIISIGIINWIINSSNFISKLGFLHGLMLADGQPCASSNQCEGGYCCSNKCASSACPVEEAAVAAAGGPEAGAGGAGILVINKDYSVSPSFIKVELVVDKSKKEKITIENTGNVELDFSLSVMGIEDFVSLSDYSFSLGIGKSKTVVLDVYGKDFGAYSGEIVIDGGGIEKRVLIVIEVKSEIVLFDVKMDIPADYKEVEAGSNLKAQITLLNVGAPAKSNVSATYLMKDFTGNVVYEATETFAVDKQKSFVKNFPVPKSVALGDHLAVIEVRYSNSFAVSSEIFKVVKKPFVTLQKLLKMPLHNLILIIALLLIILFLFMFKLLPKRISRQKNKR